MKLAAGTIPGAFLGYEFLCWVVLEPQLLGGHFGILWRHATIGKYRPPTKRCTVVVQAVAEIQPWYCTNNIVEYAQILRNIKYARKWLETRKETLVMTFSSRTAYSRNLESRKTENFQTF